MQSEGMTDEGDPNDRGMPGVTLRGQQQDMPEVEMEEGKSASSGQMPAGGMGHGAGSGRPGRHRRGRPR